MEHDGPFGRMQGRPVANHSTAHDSYKHHDSEDSDSKHAKNEYAKNKNRERQRADWFGTPEGDNEAQSSYHSNYAAHDMKNIQRARPVVPQGGNIVFGSSPQGADLIEYSSNERQQFSAAYNAPFATDISDPPVYNPRKLGRHQVKTPEATLYDMAPGDVNEDHWMQHRRKKVLSKEVTEKSGEFNIINGEATAGYVPSGRLDASRHSKQVVHDKKSNPHAAKFNIISNETF